MTTQLTDGERHLLKWMADEEFSQYGECRGTSLDGLIAKGLAQVHGPFENQGGFIAKEPPGIPEADAIDYRAVSLTDAGRAEAAKLS